MRIVRQYTELATKDRGACAAIGNFDGVHLGHRSIVDITRTVASQKMAPLGIVTFEPHPRAFFAPHAAPFRLTDPNGRAEKLRRLGVELLYELPFDKIISGLSPEEFARDVICEGLGLRHAVVGANFRFGKNREGDVEMLSAFGDRLGFGVTIVPLRNDPMVCISSTSIRNSLVAGQPRSAARQLGESHRLVGKLHCLGRQTYSLILSTNGKMSSNILLPRAGQYSIRAQLLDMPDSKNLSGIASVSCQTGQTGDPIVVFLTLFGACQTLHGKEVSVAIVDYHG